MPNEGDGRGAIALLSQGGRSRRWTAQRMLTHALREVGRAAQWRQVFGQFSVVRDVSLSLAAYLTLFIPALSGQHSLLGQSMLSALDAWERCSNACNQFDQYQAFLRGLLEPVPDALEWSVRVTGSEGDSYWDPMLEGLLHLWRERGGVVEVSRRQRPRDSTFVDIAPADFRLVVLVRFLARTDLRLAALAPRFSELVSRRV